MSFRPRLLTQPLPTRTPDVEFFFHGQLLLRSDGEICEVGINPIAKDHVLTVEVRVKRADRPVERTIPDHVDVLAMRHVGPLDFRAPEEGMTVVPREGMTIDVVEEPSTIAVWKCIGDDPLDLETGVGRWEEDFRWILNFEGPNFHNQPLHPNVFNTQHVIRLQNGEYFFRTAFRSPDQLLYTRHREGDDDAFFRKIGAVARASVFLERDQSVVLKWTDGSEPRSHSLTRGLPGITYEVYVQNTPLFQPDPQKPEDYAAFEELVHYYKIIPGIESAARFTLEPSNVPLEEGESGTPTIPCQVLRLDWPDGD
jgi:hypothetical protein